MAHRPGGMEVPPVPACDAGRFLPAMLQGMEAKRNHGRGGFSAPHTEYAALLAQLVVVKGMCRKHRAHLSAIWRSQLRSEERRVGKECVRTCRYRWSQDN